MLVGSPTTHQSIFSSRASSTSIDPARAVDRRPFLVAGEQERECAAWSRMPGDEPLGRRHHRREAALHVGGAASVQDAVANHGLERVGVPVLARTGRHDVRVTGEAEHRAVVCRACPEILDRTETAAVRLRKPERLEPGADHIAGSRDPRGSRRAGAAGLRSGQSGRGDIASAGLTPGSAVSRARSYIQGRRVAGARHVIAQRGSHSIKHCAIDVFGAVTRLSQ